MAFKHIFLVGATGSLGSVVLKALLAVPEFSVTILARPGSSIIEDPPTDTTKVAVIGVNLADADAVAEVLRGAEVLVSTVGNSGLLDQKRLIDAAIAAGVKRFIPSDFGTDFDNPRARTLPVFRDKIEVREYLVEKAREGKIEYTSLANGIFLDWGLKYSPFGLDVEKRTATLFDGGERLFSSTLLEDVATAIVGILSQPDLPETKNQQVFVHSLSITQKGLVEVLESIVGQKFETSVVSTEELVKEGNERLQRGDRTGVIGQIQRAVYGPDYGGDFSGREISRKLGIAVLDGVRLEKVVRNIWQL